MSGPTTHLPPDFGPIVDPNGLSGTDWLDFQDARALTAEKEVQSLVSLLFARFLGRDVLTVSLLDDPLRLLAIGSVESLPGVRAAESFLYEVWTCAFCTAARWALPMSFATRPRRAAYLRPVEGRCWFRLDDVDGLGALLGGAWLTPAIGAGHSDFGPTLDPNGQGLFPDPNGCVAARRPRQPSDLPAGIVLAGFHANRVKGVKTHEEAQAVGPGLRGGPGRR